MIQGILSILSFIGITVGVIEKPADFRVPIALTAEAYQADSHSILRTSGFPRSEKVSATIQKKQNNKPEISAISALVVDDKTDMILFEKDTDKIMPLASLTKLATVLTFLKLEIDLDKKFEVIEDDVVELKSALRAGDIVTNRDLLGLALVGSSNTAAHSLIRASGLQSKIFVQEMNNMADSIGLTNSFFVEPTGLDAKNVGSARDVYRLLKEVLKNDEISELMSNPEYLFNNGKVVKKVFSTNVFKLGILPFSGDTIIGAKTGYIPEAGYHFAMEALDNFGNVRQIIILGAQEHFSRFSEADLLLKWAE